MKKPEPRLGIWAIALLTASLGIINLLSAVTPGLPARVAWLRTLFPFAVSAGSSLFTVISGFLLLSLATNLLRRKRLAWAIALVLASISTLSHLIKGLDYEESLLSTILVALLWGLRREFTARSDRPSVAQGVRVLIGALLFTLAYGTAGFFLMEQQYQTDFTLTQAIRQTLAMFFTLDRGGLVPVTPFGQFFARSIYIVGASTLLYAMFMLGRPVLLRDPASPEERQKAQAIVEKYGASSLAYLTLLPDKSYYFSPSQQSVIAYVPKGRGAVALGDPIGPEFDRLDAIAGFQRFCQENDWYPAFYQTQPE
ncbi:MAG: DUF2156 domain-containing protein, partial [Chloroflexi bacterium]